MGNRRQCIWSRQRIQKYLEEKDKKYIFAVSGKEYFRIGFRQYLVKEIKEHLENDEWVKIGTGNGIKGEKVFEWQYTEVNCSIENNRNRNKRTECDKSDTETIFGNRNR